MQENDISVGLIIKRFRMEKNVSIEDLAIASGINARYISLLEEAGEHVTIAVLDKLARAMNLDLFTVIFYAQVYDITLNLSGRDIYHIKSTLDAALGYRENRTS